MILEGLCLAVCNVGVYTEITIKLGGRSPQVFSVIFLCTSGGFSGFAEP